VAPYGLARRLAFIALALAACAGTAPGSCEPSAQGTCEAKGGTCGDGTGPACAPDASHIDYSQSCVPTVGASGKLGAVCCMPGAADAGDGVTD
jgi:hypothetical protein